MPDSSLSTNARPVGGADLAPHLPLAHGFLGNVYKTNVRFMTQAARELGYQIVYRADAKAAFSNRPLPEHVACYSQTPLRDHGPLMARCQELMIANYVQWAREWRARSRRNGRKAARR